MRELALKDFWADLGANFGELGGAQCAANFGNPDAEYLALRNSAALCDFSFVRIAEFPESDGMDFLDGKLAANILKLRYGRIIDTFLAYPDGGIAAEAFVANIDDRVFAVLESLDDSPGPLAGGNGRDATGEFAVLSVDGPRAWEVAKDIFGSDIFNLPYPAVEKYEFEGEPAYLLRNGKTGEFGYSFAVPAARAEKLARRLLGSVKNVGGAPCGTDAHAVARLESGFFNIYREGKSVGSPVELCLQWMADFSKESFIGSDAIFRAREAGAEARITAVRGPGVKTGARAFDGNVGIGEVKVAMRSPSLGDSVGLALIKSDFAYPSLELSSAPGGEADIFTVSRPMTVSESLIRGMQQ